MADKPVMMIIPTESGYVFMPFQMNVLLALGDARKQVHACETLESLAEKVREFYAPDEPTPEPGQ